MSGQVFKSREGFDSNKRKVINVAKGIDPLDAVNVEQMLEKISELTAGRITPYIESAGYAVGALVIYKNRLYQTDTLVIKPAGPFNPNIWKYIGYNIDDVNAGSSDTLYSSLRIDQLLAALEAANINYSNNTNIPNSPSNVQQAIEEIHRNLTAIQNGVVYLGILQVNTTVPNTSSGDYYFAGFDGTHPGINGGLESFLEGNTVIFNGTDWDIISQNIGVVDIDGFTGSITGKLIRTDTGNGTEQTIATTIKMSNQPIKELGAPVDGTDAVNKDYLESTISAGGIVKGPVSVFDAWDTSSGNPLSVVSDVHGQALEINTLNGNITIDLYIERDNTSSFAPQNVKWSLNGGLTTPILDTDLLPLADKPGFIYKLILSNVADGSLIQLYNGDSVFETKINIVSNIVISSVLYSNNQASGTIYPAGQTAVKDGDKVFITVTSATPFNKVSISGIGTPEDFTIASTLNATIEKIVSSTDSVNKTALVSISDANGTSSPVSTSNGIKVDNSTPVISITNTTYPGTQQALKAVEIATVSISYSNSVSLSIQDLIGEISVPSGTALVPSFSVTRTGGGYNTTQNNLSVTVTGANGKVASVSGVINIANSSLVLFLQSSSSLRSSGDLGEQETISLSGNQEMLTSPLLSLEAPDGTITSNLAPTSITSGNTTVNYDITIEESWGKGSVVASLLIDASGNNLAGIPITFVPNTMLFAGFYLKQVVVLGPNLGGSNAPVPLSVSVYDTSKLSALLHRVNNSTPGFSVYTYDPGVTSTADSGATELAEFGIIPEIANPTLSSLVIDSNSVILFGGDNLEINIEEL